MKNIFRQITSLVLAAGLVVIFQSFAIAQSEKSDISGIEGVWRTVVTPRICANGAPITTFPGQRCSDHHVSRHSFIREWRNHDRHVDSGNIGLRALESGKWRT
jgi:hypothetical protein